MGKVSQQPDYDERQWKVRALQTINACLCRVYHQVTLTSPCRLPRTGPAILISNHISGLDPLLLQSVSPRLIRWMMAREYYELPGLKRIYQRVGAIPVERAGKDIAATRAALAALKAGHILGVFPEGKIAPTHELLPFQSGIALLALKSGAPVYPAYLDGSQRGLEMLPAVLTANWATISFGPPQVFNRSSPARAGFDEITEEIKSAVDFLRKEQSKRRINGRF